MPSKKGDILMNQDEQFAVEKYKILLQLWASENPIKTQKIRALLLLNSILVPGFLLTQKSIYVALVGFAFSLVWVFSLGRTIAFQHHWRTQMEKLRRQHRENPILEIHAEEQELEFYGRVPSKYILLGSVAISTVVWLLVVQFAWLSG